MDRNARKDPRPAIRSNIQVELGQVDFTHAPKKFSRLACSLVAFLKSIHTSILPGLFNAGSNASTWFLPCEKSRQG
jgi:hypothetical protein